MNIKNTEVSLLNDFQSYLKGLKLECMNSKEYEVNGILKDNSIIKIKEFEKYAVCIEYYSKKILLFARRFTDFIEA